MPNYNLDNTREEAAHTTNATLMLGKNSQDNELHSKPKLKSGWIFLDKPAGIISRKLLNIVQRKLDAKKAGKKIGFAGTLDPFATGLLPIAVGSATRLIEYLMAQNKEYIFEIQFGIHTDSYDITGNILKQEKTQISSSQITELLPEFIGITLQKPPAFSAVKIDGRRACDIARQTGEILDIKAKEINIESLELLSFNEETQFAKMKMSCHSGTYVRSFIVDLAEKLGCFAIASSIHRSKVGKISNKEIISLENLLELLDNDLADKAILPMDTVLDDILAVEMGETDFKKLKDGVAVTGLFSGAQLVRLYNNEEFFGIGKIENWGITPIKIFNNTQ